jgi:hypothetical protein
MKFIGITRLNEGYNEALNHAIKAVIESRVLSLGKAHRLLYSILRERYSLPSKSARSYH